MGLGCVGGVVDWNWMSLFHDLELFNQKLVDWLIFYNTKRPHFSLGNIPPVKYLILKVGFSNMVWTHTRYCIFKINPLNLRRNSHDT